MTRRSRRRRSRRTDIWPRLYRRHPGLAVAVVIVAVLLAWQRGRTPGPAVRPADDQSRYHNQVFTCVKVVDGDTLDVNVPDGTHDATRIRLWGVDTPEVAGSPAGEMHFGPEASAFTKSLVAGQRVRLVLEPHDTRGVYGRLLAYVYLDGTETMLNRELVARGHAYADPRFRHRLRDAFIDLEREAREQGLGLWAEVTVERMPAWRQKRERSN